MTADDDRGDRRLEPNTPEWFAENRRRHGHPNGPHARPAESDDPMRASTFHPRADVSELVEMLHGMRVGEGPTPPAAPPAKSKLDLSINIPTIVLLGGIVLGGFQGWNYQNERIAAVERGVQDGKDRATKYVPVIEALSAAVQGQTNENRMQNDRIQSVASAIADERKSRQDDGGEVRASQASTLALIAKLTDKVSDIGTDVAIIKSGGRRSEGPAPDHDAQAMRSR